MDKKTSFAVIIILIAIIGFISFSGKHSSTGLSKNEEQATSAVKEIISQYLVAPATTQYASFTIRLSNNDKNKYVAFGDLDSQNSYGALIRSHFLMFLIHTDGAFSDVKNYTVDSFYLGDDIVISGGKVPQQKMTLSELNSLYPENAPAMKNLEDSIKTDPTLGRF